MSLEEERLSAPTEALASFEPFVQWLLSASLDDLSVVPDDIFSTLVGASEDGSNTESEDEEEWATKGTQCQQKEERPSFETTCHARLALAETEGELEAAWDGLSCTLREWRLLDEKLLTLQEERDENCKFIELLERRIIKLLQDRDLAIAETYTIERQIKDAETFKAQQQQRERQQEEEQKNVRVALTLRKLLLRRSNDESDNTKAGEFPISSERPKYTEKDVQRLHKELADSKVAAAVAKAERDERRYAMRQTERRCVELKLALAQARAEEDDLQISLQQLTRARRNSLDHLQKISLFSAAEMPLQPPPAPTAGLAIPYAFSLLNSTGAILSSLDVVTMKLKPVHFAEESDEEEEEQNPGAFMWIEGDSLAPPCQSDRDVVSTIVEIARMTSDDVLFDLGCGDGRICIEAAKRFGARARGVEIEDFLVERFRKLIVANDLQRLVNVSHGDLMEEDLSEATVIVTYLLPDALNQLKPKFTKLLSQTDKNVRIICNTWGICGLTPDERYDVGPYNNVPLFVYRSKIELSTQMAHG